MKIETVFIICILGLFYPSSSRAEFRYVDTTTHSFLWPEDHWNHWNQNKNVVQLSVILPDNATFEANINMTGPGILRGINEAKSRSLINDVVFNVTFRNSGCNSTFGPGSFNNAVFQGVDVIFGPTCEYALGKKPNLYRFPFQEYHFSFLSFRFLLRVHQVHQAISSPRLINFLALKHCQQTIDCPDGPDAYLGSTG